MPVEFRKKLTGATDGKVMIHSLNLKDLKTHLQDQTLAKKKLENKATFGTKFK